MRIAIVGAGVAGMAAAWMLQDDHRVTLFDRAPRLGGHVETLPIVVEGQTVHGELGPRFFFDSAYPHFLALLRLLSVPLQWRDARVSFTDVAADRTIVLPPRSLRHAASLARAPRLARHLLSLHRLIAEQGRIARERDYSVTLRRHLADGGYPSSFGPEFAYPFLSACWGAPLDRIPDFPIYSLLKGMPPGTRPGFYEIDGGMGRYVRALGRELARVDLRLGSGIRCIEHRRRFWLEDDHGEAMEFDQLIVATPAWDAGQLLQRVPDLDALREAVAAFGFFDIEIALHGDASYMPSRRDDWADNNLFVDGDVAWMSDWQGHGANAPLFRTWVPHGRPMPAPLHAHRCFRHVLMTPENAVLQRRIAALQGEHGAWVIGMYTVDVDNHESALLSALVPVRAMAPRAPNLRRLLGAVGRDAMHDLGILPSGPSHARLAG